MGANPDRPEAGHRRALNRQLRAAFLAGAEERSIRDMGRGLTEDELQAVLRRYPGNLPERNLPNR